MAKRESQLASKIPIDMTPMIDVVFQLLTFFMLTLKTVVVEGDFNIRMPLGASAGAAEENPIPPIILKMTATPEGRLSGVQIGGKSIVGQDLLGQLGSADATLDAAVASTSSERAKQITAAKRGKETAAAALVQVIQAQILDAFGNDLSRAELTELELDCDPALKYDYVVSAINAASGVVQGDQVVPLIQKIKFSPPRKQK
ncbi:MAG: ExbD/TolR family protein [Planctomycetota bacterium]